MPRGKRTSMNVDIAQFGSGPDLHDGRGLWIRRAGIEKRNVRFVLRRAAAACTIEHGTQAAPCGHESVVVGAVRSHEIGSVGGGIPYDGHHDVFSRRQPEDVV